MNRYKLIFKGKDFSPIPDFSEPESSKYIEIKDENGNKIDLDQFPVELKNNLTSILIAFLDSFDEKQLASIYKNIDDTEDEEEKQEKKKLYTTFNGEKNFNGQIGFLRKSSFLYPVVNENGIEISSQYDLDITLRCTSRFDEDDKGYFLCSMLLHSDLSFVDSLIPTDDEDDVFEYMLLFRYISLLRESFVKGFYKKYVSFQNNDDHLRGSIDIARHIRLNSGYDNGKIAYSYRENTVQNPLNMLIIVAYNKLKNRFADLMETCFTRDDEEIINSLYSEVGFIECSISELIKLNNKPIYHPYYFEYEGLREVCLKILRDEGMNLFPQEDMAEANGFLVYIPNLWEKYLQYHFECINDVYYKPQDPNRIAYITNEEKSALTIRPDFVFYKDNDKTKPFAMIDAKFIPRWSVAVNRCDFSKVSIDFNKCVRDMTCLEIHKTGVVFPHREKDIYKEFSITSYKHDLFVALGISIPTIEKDDSFYLWNNKFEIGVANQIKEYLSRIKE